MNRNIFLLLIVLSCLLALTIVDAGYDHGKHCKPKTKISSDTVTVTVTKTSCVPNSVSTKCNVPIKKRDDDRRDYDKRGHRDHHDHHCHKRTVTCKPTKTICVTPTPTCAANEKPCDLDNPGACCSQTCCNFNPPAQPTCCF